MHPTAPISFKSPSSMSGRFCLPSMRGGSLLHNFQSTFSPFVPLLTILTSYKLFPNQLKSSEANPVNRPSAPSVVSNQHTKHQISPTLKTYIAQVCAYLLTPQPTVLSAYACGRRSYTALPLHVFSGCNDFFRVAYMRSLDFQSCAYGTAEAVL